MRPTRTDDWQSSSQNGYRIAKRQVGALSGRQCGRITWAQLRALGASPGTINRWVATGYLVRVLPRVYAVGHVGSDERARLFSLVLFAGPGAALSHGTAAHSRGWLRYPVKATHISTPRRVRPPAGGVVIHCRRNLERELVDGLPCTTALQTLFDVAASEPLRLVRRIARPARLRAPARWRSLARGVWTRAGGECCAAGGARDIHAAAGAHQKRTGG